MTLVTHIHNDGGVLVPLVRIDLSDRRPASTGRQISDGVHRAMVEVIGIPEEDRFHLITTHPQAELIAHPTYLARREDVVYLQITLVGGRPPELKVALYRRIAQLLGDIEDVRAADVSIVLTENAPADYSWGDGEAQLLSMGPVPGTG